MSVYNYIIFVHNRHLASLIRYHLDYTLSPLSTNGFPIIRALMRLSELKLVPWPIVQAIRRDTDTFLFLRNHDSEFLCSLRLILKCLRTKVKLYCSWILYFLLYIDIIYSLRQKLRLEIYKHRNLYNDKISRFRYPFSFPQLIEIQGEALYV